ncbi:hypothetical protein [Streptomyces sp. NPDC096339]|uniref:DUF7224 domain-containing protein n=1 Tax=Streptomyces sp. NPDC096339 TaxID=3366086 RepID=UPI003828B553
MRTSTLLRSSSAGLMLVFAAGYVFLLLSEPIRVNVTASYGPSVLGAASYAIPFAAAACAASGAWESSRLRRGRVFAQAPARGHLTIALQVLAPVWALGVISMGIASAIASSAAGALPPLSYLGMFAVYALLMAAASGAGYLLGARIHHLAAAPIAMIAVFFFTAFPGSWKTPWPRHLVGGGYDACCSVGSVIDPSAVWAPLLFAAGATGACILAIARKPWWTSALALAAASGAAIALVAGMGFNPTKARSAEAMVCDRRAVPEVCLWPETPGRDRIIDATRVQSARLEAAGLPLPDSFTQSRTLKDGQAGFGGKGQVREGSITPNLVNMLLPPIPRCARTGQSYPAFPARGPLTGWLASIATGTPPQPIQGTVSFEDAKLAQQVLTLPPERQHAWYEKNRQALTGCEQSPSLSPEGAGS